MIINSIFANTLLGFASAEAKEDVLFRLTYESNWVQKCSCPSFQIIQMFSCRDNSELKFQKENKCLVIIQIIHFRLHQNNVLVWLLPATIFYLILRLFRGIGGFVRFIVQKRRLVGV